MKSGTNEKGAVSWIIKLILGVIVLVIVSVLLFGAFRDAGAAILNFLGLPGISTSSNPVLQDAIKYSQERCSLGCNKLQGNEIGYLDFVTFSSVAYGLCEQLPSIIKEGSDGKVCGTEAKVFPIEIPITDDKSPDVPMPLKPEKLTLSQTDVYRDFGYVTSKKEAAERIIGPIKSGTQILLFAEEIAQAVEKDFSPIDFNWKKMQIKPFSQKIYISTSLETTLEKIPYEVTVVDNERRYELLSEKDGKFSGDIKFNTGKIYHVSAIGKDFRSDFAAIYSVVAEGDFFDFIQKVFKGETIQVDKSFLVQSPGIVRTTEVSPGKTHYFPVIFSGEKSLKSGTVKAEFKTLTPGLDTTLTFEPLPSVANPLTLDAFTENPAFEEIDLNKPLSPKILGMYSAKSAKVEHDAKETVFGHSSIKISGQSLSSVTLDLSKLSNFDPVELNTLHISTPIDLSKDYKKLVFHFKADKPDVIPIVRLVDDQNRNCELVQLKAAEFKGKDIWFEPLVLELNKDNFSCSKEPPFTVNNIVVSKIEFKIIENNINTVWIDGLRFTS